MNWKWLDDAHALETFLAVGTRSCLCFDQRKLLASQLFPSLIFHFWNSCFSGLSCISPVRFSCIQSFRNLFCNRACGRIKNKRFEEIDLTPLPPARRISRHPAKTVSIPMESTLYIHINDSPTRRKQWPAHVACSESNNHSVKFREAHWMSQLSRPADVPSSQKHVPSHQ